VLTTLDGGALIAGAPNTKTITVRLKVSTSIRGYKGTRAVGEEVVVNLSDAAYLIQTGKAEKVD